MSYLFTCTAMLVALALIGVGGLVIRKAHPTSGYLFMGAGAFLFLMRCCTGFVSSERLLEAGLDYDQLGLVVFARMLLHGTELILVAILLAIALVMLAKKVPADVEDAPGGDA